MVDAPVTISLKFTGVKEARQELERLQATLGKQEGLRQFVGGVKNGAAETNALGRAISYSNRSFRVQHQSLYEAGKAFRIFGSAMRSAMSIMNTLSLLTIAQSTQQTSLKSNIADLKTDLISLDLELTNLEKHGKQDSIEYQLKLNEKQKILNDIKDVEKQLEETTKNETWQKWLTAGFAISEGVSAMFSILNNPKFGPKIIDVFGKIFAPLGKSISAWGLAHGTLYGTSIMAGITVGLAGLSELLQDVMGGKTTTEQVTGKRPTKIVKETTGIDIPTLPQGQTGDLITAFMGGIGNIISKLTELNKKGINLPSFVSSSMFAHAEMGGVTQGPQQVTGPMGNLVNTFGSKPIPVKITDISRPIFKDLGTGTSGSITASGTLEQVETTIDNTDVIIEETKILKDEAKEAKKRASDNARMHHEAEVTALAAKQAMFEQTEATNALRLQMFQQQTLALQMGGLTGTNYGSSSGGGFGPGQGYGTSPSGYLGSNGKWYSDDEEAAKNGAAARGFNGIIDSPTNMLMGENGPEHVNITPMRYGGGGGGGSVIINNYISGSVISEKELQKLSMEALKSGLKRVGF